MQIGLIGLGRMGLNLALNMRDHGHEVIGYDLSKQTVDRAKGEGIKGVYILEELVEKLIPPRLIWLMVPAGDTVDMVINKLVPLLSKGRHYCRWGELLLPRYFMPL